MIAHGRLFGWAVLLGAVLLGGTALSFIWRRHPCAAEPIYARRWLCWFRMGAIATGIVWGIGGLMLAPSEDRAHLIYVSFVLGGLSAGAATTLAIDRISALGFLLSVLVPHAVFVATLNDILSLGMNAMIVLYLFFSWPARDNRVFSWRRISFCGRGRPKTNRDCARCWKAARLQHTSWTLSATGFDLPIVPISGLSIPPLNGSLT